MRTSVAMCTFNGERYLERQLESMAAQTRLPDELIVSDDGSTDSTLEIVEKFSASGFLPVEISVNPRRLGPTGNYEQAIGRCRGDLIVLCDQDDVWLPERVARLEQVFETSPGVALAFSDAYLVRTDGRRTGDLLWHILGFSPRQQRHMRRDPFGQLMGRSIVTGCTLALRASGRDLLLPFPEEETGSRARVLHDRWISLVLSAAFDVGVIEDPLVEYRLHPAQQVGIPALNIRKLVPSSMMRWRSAAVPSREHTARLNANVVLLEMIAERLRDLLPPDRSNEAIARVQEAIEHLRARAAIRGLRTTRVAPVLGEAATGRYQRYSLGVASVAADLIRSDDSWGPAPGSRR